MFRIYRAETKLIVHCANKIGKRLMRLQQTLARETATHNRVDTHTEEHRVAISKVGSLSTSPSIRDSTPISCSCRRRTPRNTTVTLASVADAAVI